MLDRQRHNLQLVVHRSLAEVACREVVGIAGQGRHIVLRIAEWEEHRKAELLERRRTVLEGRHRAVEVGHHEAADVVEGHHMHSELVVDYMRLSMAVDYIAVLPGAAVHSFVVRMQADCMKMALHWSRLQVVHNPLADHN